MVESRKSKVESQEVHDLRSSTLDLGPSIVVRDPIDRLIEDVLLGYQAEHLRSNARFRRLNWSRQTGKSFAATLRRIFRGIARKRNQFFLSAGERQSRELMMKVRTHLEALKLAFSTDERVVGTFDNMKITQLECHIPEIGIRILGLPANPMTARGFTGDVLLDEFAMHRDDREIWAAMFPSIMRGGGELDVASTPRGKQNLFYELSQNEEFEHQKVTIHDAVRQGLDVDTEELRRAINDDLLWRQEFLCEYVDGATAFLTYELIRSCEDEKLSLELDIDAIEAMRTGDLLGGLDIGRHKDLTVLWVLEAVGSQLITRGLIELSSMPFRTQYEIIERVCACRCMRKMCVDATGLGMQFAEELVTRFGDYRVEACTFTAALKEQMAGKLRVGMEDHRVAIPADKRIRNDLHSIEKSVTVDGKIRLRATRQEGSHADRFWALALAVHAAADDVGPVESIMGPDLVSVGARDW